MASFDKTKLVGYNLKAERVWRDAQALTNQVPLHIDAVKAIKENQTAVFSDLVDQNQNRKIGVSFITDCDGTTRAAVDECTLTGNELNSDVKVYDLNLNQETSFKVQHFMHRDNEYSTDEVIARGIMNAKARLDNYLGTIVLAQLGLSKGKNQFAQPFNYDDTANTTMVPQANWNPKLVGNLMQQALLNNIQNPYYISDGNLFVDYLNAEFDSVNADGRGDFRRTKALKLYFDQVNFLKAGVSDNLFMIDRSAVGLTTKAYYGAGIEDLDTIKSYSVPSDNIPGVRYDVEYQFVCENKEGARKFFHVFKFTVRGLFALNPVACDSLTTGVLGYSIKEETPEVGG